MYYNDYNHWNEEPTPQLPALPAVPQQEPPRKKRGWLKVTALCLACALVGGSAGAAGVIALGGQKSVNAPTSITVSSRAPAEASNVRVDGLTPMTVAQVYETNLASVVGVNGDVKTNYWGQVVSNAVSGSGFVITSDGYILTNYHVIDGVDDLKVFFADGSTYDAVLVGGEAANDIAVLKIDATGLQPVVVGSSNDTKVGEQVVAIGNPLHQLTFTLTSGYLSGKDRLITMSDGKQLNVLQTDAAINSGNSGGPLFNLYGECIGITNAKRSNNGSTAASIEGISFAIPIDDVIDMVTDIIEKGYVTGKPNLGILMAEVSDEAILRYGVPDGVYITAVLDGSAADKAGVQSGDIITVFGGTEVTSSSELKDAVKRYKAGDRVELTLWREGKTHTFTAVLDEYDQERVAAIEQLQQEYRESQQQTQQPQQPQQSQGSQGTITWPFSSWPFGGMWW